MCVVVVRTQHSRSPVTGLRTDSEIQVQVCTETQSVQEDHVDLLMEIKELALCHAMSDKEAVSTSTEVSYTSAHSMWGFSFNL